MLSNRLQKYSVRLQQHISKPSLHREYALVNDLVDILENIRNGKCDEVDFHVRVRRHIWNLEVGSRGIPYPCPTRG